MNQLSSRRLREQLAGLWTQNDIAARTGKTAMAVYLWTQRVKDPLPYIPIPGFKKDSVRFVPEEVRRWCKRNDMELHEEEQGAKRKRVTLKAA